MAAADLRFEGLDELYRALATLPDRLNGAAEEIAQSEAEQMQRDLPGAYAAAGFDRQTGELADRVLVTRVTTPASTGYQVTNRSRKAAWVEFGTVQRFTRGSGAARGRFIARPVFVPMAQRRRRSMLRRLVEFVRQQGAVVTGA